MILAAASGLAAWLVPAAPDMIPGAAFVELAALVEGRTSDVVAWQSAGVALVVAALLLGLARLALERAAL